MDYFDRIVEAKETISKVVEQLRLDTYDAEDIACVTKLHIILGLLQDVIDGDEGCLR